MLSTEGGEGGVSVVLVALVARGGEWSWSAEMRAARVAASAVPRRVVRSVARVGGRSVMMCGGDGGRLVQTKWVLKWLRVGCGRWCGGNRGNGVIFGLMRSVAESGCDSMCGILVLVGFGGRVGVVTLVEGMCVVGRCLSLT